MNQQRLARVLKEMAAQKIPQLLVSDPTAIFYLTGKWIHPGERMLVLSIDSNGTAKIFLGSLFAFSEDIGAEVFTFSDTEDPVALLASHLGSETTIGVDKNWPARFLLKLQAQKSGAAIVNGSPVVDRVRMCKDEEEIARMAEASRLNDLAVDQMIKLIPANLTEKQMAKKLAEIYDGLGAEGFSFEPIICYGANSADPHHLNDDGRVKPGDAVILDIGCVKDNYCSDMTRTVFYKSVSDEMKTIYNTVLEANLKAIRKVKPGVSFAEVDAAARDHITAAGYGQYFVHRTGHSIGLECHDFGDVSSANHDLLQPGMIFSIEPGIYLPGKGGVRIEDLVVVTADGCRVLNQYPKDLRIID
ncbi:MAG TPA: Xaa-Pro peptidase family protein [Selenomonadales bacterium]|nr:Xaa-Pro peptidase family protein [Selenomonadales bacterium]